MSGSEVSREHAILLCDRVSTGPPTAFGKPDASLVKKCGVAKALPIPLLESLVTQGLVHPCVVGEFLGNCLHSSWGSIWQQESCLSDLTCLCLGSCGPRHDGAHAQEGAVSKGQEFTLRKTMACE